MAHYAKIGLNNKVILVVPFDDNKILDANGVEQEEVGRQILENETGWPLWIKTSIGTTENKHYIFNSDNVRVLSDNQSKAFRGNFASLGYTWDEENQIFWPPKPYSTFIKDLTTASWKSTTPFPAITTYTENGIEKPYSISYDNDNVRYLAGKINDVTKVCGNYEKYWNPNTNAWINI
jgi:hypothetical protein